MLESEADRLALIKSTGGELVTVDGNGVWAIFTDAHTPLQFGLHVVDSTDPQIMARASDIADLVSGSVVVRGSKNYGVASIQPDGVGMTTVMLHEL
jgi:hypothetical protein